MSLRRGFTLIELLVVILIISILVGIVVPRYQASRVRAEAVKVMSDMRNVRTAAFQVSSDSGVWPADTPNGVVPPALQTVLGAGFLFSNIRYDLDWDIVQFGSPAGAHAAITVRSTDESLIEAVRRQFGASAPALSTSTTYTWILDRLPPSSGG